MKLETKILLSLASLMKNKERHITGYRLAKEIGVERSQVYRCLNNLAEKHAVIIDVEIEK